MSVEDVDLETLNKKISNSNINLSSIKAFEIILESLVYQIYDIFGKNSLLSMLYQIGKGPGEIIAKRLKQKYKKEEFEILEAIEIILNELRDFYKVQLRDIDIKEDKVRIIVENHCFLRESIKKRKNLQFGKTLCRINKGYFETALRILLGNKIKNIEINFLENDEKNDICVEELNFYLL